jgi:hypothetical protein
VALLGPESSAGVQKQAAGALLNLASNNAENKVKIAAAGAISPLVALLGPQSSAVLQEQAAGALRNLAANNAENKVKIRHAGAEGPLNRLLSSTDEKVKTMARATLTVITE